MINIKNKKANIPVTILVVATIGICVVALLAFHINRKAAEEQINVFRYLRVMYNVQNDIAYSGNDLSYVKQLYNQQSWISKTAKGYRNYYPVVEQMKKENGFLIYKQVKIYRKARFGIPPWEKIETILFELKVPL